MMSVCMCVFIRVAGLQFSMFSQQMEGFESRTSDSKFHALSVILLQFVSFPSLGVPFLFATYSVPYLF